MPAIQSRQLEFTYSACGPFGEKKKRIQKFLKRRGSRYIFPNDLHKSCF